MRRSLAYTHRKLSRQWAYEKNEGLTPKDVTQGSGRRVWWRCDEGPDHVWQATVASRARAGRGCPFCSHHSASVTNSLASLFPDIAAQWNSEKNGSLTPDEVTAGSSRRVHWVCDAGPDHDWATSISHRTSNGSGCPYCAGRMASVTNNLEVNHPELAAEFHPGRNGELTPASVTFGSGKKVWWQCAHGHEWKAAVVDRVGRGTGCPYCATKIPTETNSLAALHPHLAEEWHKSRNGDLRPMDVVPGSNRKVWWRCGANPAHEFEAYIKHRTEKSTRCPYCSRRRAAPETSLATTHPEVAAQWHPTKNDGRRPDDYLPGSPKKAWWVCDVQHEWEACIADRALNDIGCPFCSNRRVTWDNCLANKHRKIASEWHPSRNGKLTPKDVVAGTRQLAWWKCDKGPDHVWRTNVEHRTRNHSGCPFCSGRRASKKTSLAANYPILAKEFHPTKNGDLTPADFTCGSGRKVWWLCPRGPDHEWEQQVRYRINKSGVCPYCAGRLVSVTNSLQTLFPNVAREWHPKLNHDLTSKDVLAASKDFAWWKCAVGHEWKDQIANRTIRRQGCPQCTFGAV